ncbi:hypothetical protein EI555_000226, partial [Monodon monoceros]
TSTVQSDVYVPENKGTPYFIRVNLHLTLLAQMLTKQQFPTVDNKHPSTLQQMKQQLPKHDPIYDEFDFLAKLLSKQKFACCHLLCDCKSHFGTGFVMQSSESFHTAISTIWVWKSRRQREVRGVKKDIFKPVASVLQTLQMRTGAM